MTGIRSLLVVGAHAFDAEVIAGPLAATVVRSGGRSTFVHLSLGEQGHPSLAPAEYAMQKRDEAEAAAAALGCDMVSLDLPDGFVPVTDEIALRLCDIVREVRPDVVVTHWSGSWHKDHRAAHTLTANAVFYAALPTLARAASAHASSSLLFGENWEDADGFHPARMLDVSTGMEAWRSAVQCYELARGLSNFPYYDYYSSLYRMRGCLAGCTHAQGFAVQSGDALAGIGQFVGDPAQR